MKKIITKRLLLNRIKDPLVEFVRLEAFGGIVLMSATLVALVISNTLWGDEFLGGWSRYFGISFGDWSLKKTFLHWINDGLMAVFFFVVGLEIKRELMTGGLSSVKKATLPVFAAIGGMVIPALIYYVINKGQPGEMGWGIPMATDIAFALGIITLLGKRIPLSLKLLLTSIAIVDDIGAVLVIAFFYTAQIYWTALIVAMVIWGVLWGMNFLKIRNTTPYIVLGVVMWYFLLKSGVHATLAGVMVAFTIPARAYQSVELFVHSGRSLLLDMCSTQRQWGGGDRQKHLQASIQTLEDNCVRVISPLQRLEHSLHPWVVYMIIPLFAFANAGIVIDNALISELGQALPMGIIAGLLLGKPVGIALLSALGVALGWAHKPDDISWSQIVGIGLLGGIGFTMSFFVSQLAFADAHMLTLSKMAVLVASCLSGVLGYLVLRFKK